MTKTKRPLTTDLVTQDVKERTQIRHKICRSLSTDWTRNQYKLRLETYCHKNSSKREIL